MTDEAEQKELPLGLVPLKTQPQRDVEALIEDLHETIEEMKEAVPNLCGYFVFGVDLDRSVYSFVNINKGCPHHSLIWPDMVRNAIMQDLIVQPPSERGETAAT
jgi:hypothetical protein